MLGICITELWSVRKNASSALFLRTLRFGEAKWLTMCINLAGAELTWSPGSQSYAFLLLECVPCTGCHAYCVPRESAEHVGWEQWYHYWFSLSLVSGILLWNKILQLGTCIPCCIYWVCEQGSPLWSQLFCSPASGACHRLRSLMGRKSTPKRNCWFVLKNRGFSFQSIHQGLEGFAQWEGERQVGREERHHKEKMLAWKSGLKTCQALNLEKGSREKQQEAEVLLMPFVTCWLWMS